MNKVKVALIGVGGYGRLYVDHLTRMHNEGRVEFAAAVIRNEAKVAETAAALRALGCRIFSSDREMYAAMAGNLDLACIPAGIEFHEPLTCDALRAGFNVLVEKPAAGSTAAVANMIAAERAARDRFVAVAFQHMYARELHEIKCRLVSGEFGRIESISAMGIWPRADAYYGRNDWAGKEFSQTGAPVFDSPINNAFAHYLNIPLFLGGATFETVARPTAIRAELYRARCLETFDNCAVKFKMAEGFDILTLFSHTATENVHPKIRVRCAKGVIDWQLDAEWAIDGVVQGKVEAPHNDMFQDVVERVSDPEIFVYTLEQAGVHTRCIEELHRHFRASDLPKTAVSRREADGQLIVAGLPETWETCFQKHIMPSESGVNWGVPSEFQTL